MRHRKKKRRDEERPDPQAAREQLERIKGRREDVDALVSALARERRLNNFTASAVIVFRGGRP